MSGDEALAIAARFGRRPVREVALAGGYSNQNVRVFDADGSSVVVRRYGRLHVTRRAVFFEHAAMRHAAARIPEVHAPLALPDGDSMLFDGGAFCAVLPFVEGAAGERELAPQFAGVLARFHVAMQNFRPQRPRAIRSVGALAWVRNRLLRLSAEPGLARKLPWNDLIVAVAGAIAHLAPLAGRLPIVTVHGDPHPENVVSRGGRVTALIDFDFAHESERAYDVAAAADSYGRCGPEGALDPAAVDVFAAAYAAHAPLLAEEVSALAPLMIRRHAVMVWYIVTRHGMRVPNDVGNAERYARRAIDLARGLRR